MARQTRVTLWLFGVKRDKETLNGLVAQGRILTSSPGGVGSLGRLVIDYTVLCALSQTLSGVEGSM